MLFTLHVYQYRVEKCGRGGSRWPRARVVGSGPLRPGQSWASWIWGPWGWAFTSRPVVSVSGGRSRLHLIDLGSCEEAPGGPPSLSLSALGSVILALVSGAKHVPYR